MKPKAGNAIIFYSMLAKRQQEERTSEGRYVLTGLRRFVPLMTLDATWTYEGDGAVDAARPRLTGLIAACMEGVTSSRATNGLPTTGLRIRSEQINCTVNLSPAKTRRFYLMSRANSSPPLPSHADRTKLYSNLYNP